MSVNKTLIILCDSKDWIKWLKVTLIASNEFDLRPYINSNLEHSALKILKELVIPSLSSILAAITPVGNRESKAPKVTDIASSSGPSKGTAEGTPKGSVLGL